MKHISHVPCPSLGSKYMCQFLLNLRTPCGLLCGPKKGNSVNLFLSQYVLQYWFYTSSFFLHVILSFCTFFIIRRFLCLPLNKIPCFVMHLTNSFETLMLKSHQDYMLMCALPFVYQTFDFQEVSMQTLSGG